MLLWLQLMEVVEENGTMEGYRWNVDRVEAHARDTARSLINRSKMEY